MHEGEGGGGGGGGGGGRRPNKMADLHNCIFGLQWLHVQAHLLS